MQITWVPNEPFPATGSWVGGSLHLPQIQSLSCSVSQEAHLYGRHFRCILALRLRAGFGKRETQLGNQRTGRVGGIKVRVFMPFPGLWFFLHSRTLLSPCLFWLKGNGCCWLVPKPSLVGPLDSTATSVNSPSSDSLQ